MNTRRTDPARRQISDGSVLRSGKKGGPRKFFTDAQIAILGKLPVVATALLTFVGLLVDLMSNKLRLILIGVAIGLFALGFIAGREERRRREARRASLSEVTRELDETLRSVKALNSGRDLERLARYIFKSRSSGVLHAWRLSVYEVILREDSESVAQLRLRRSANQEYEAGGRPEFKVSKSILRYLATMDVSNPLEPGFYESGTLPSYKDDIEGWRRWQAGIVEPSAASALRMPTRKYAFLAVLDPDSRRTVVMVAESTSPEGIATDSLKDPAVSMFTLSILRESALAREGVRALSSSIGRLGDREYP